MLNWYLCIDGLTVFTMIPKFDEAGLLPAGIHEATLDEFKSEFVYNTKRQEIYQGLLILIADLRKVGCSVLYLDGSFVTSKPRPGDIDACWEVQPGTQYLEFVNVVAPTLLKLKYPRNEQKALYKADVFPAHLPADAKNTIYREFFQLDKNTGQRKGIIKILLL